MLETMPLSPGVTLCGVRGTRFRQECLSVQLAMPMAADTAPKNALIPSVLLRATRHDGDLQAITRRLDMLYGASVSPLVRRVGDYQTVGLYCSMTDERFALPGDRILAPMLEFLRELMWDSPLYQGGFLPELVEGEKKNLLSYLDGEKNDKHSYAMHKLLNAMGARDSFGIPRLGSRERISALSPVSLREYWMDTLKSAPAVIFYAGSSPLERVGELISPLLPTLPRRTLPPQTPLTPAPEWEGQEVMDVTQGQLCLGFVTPVTLESPQFAAMQLFNVVFGAGMTSKLFTRLREELSLCYSCSSGYYSSKGVFTVYAGIDSENLEQTRREIFAQLDACRRGDFREEELQAGKEAICSGLRSVGDSPSAMEGYYVPGLLSGHFRTPEEYARQVRALTVEDLTRAANTLRYHSSFFLRGESA